MATFYQESQDIDKQNNADTININKTTNISGDTFNMSGDFRGSNPNIKASLHNVIQTIGASDDSLKEELEKLIQELHEALRQAPAEKAEEAELVAGYAEELLTKAAEKKPDKTKLKITGKGLLEAAKAVAGVIPTTLKVATKIVETITKIAP
ncbi:MAG: hypothetical protein GY862_30590 [Gammaproteobacteria bacterium]|nr:hypothetical protein [Gammaproteobacteria bacterium]